jgi:hypothetical protein
MKTCVFCGSAGKLTKEHVFPSWLRTQANVDLDLGLETLRRGGRVIARRNGGRAFNRTARIACENCNTGWMSALETRAIPLLLPLLDGFEAQLDDRAQETVASWSVKTTLAIARVRSDLPQLAPVVHYRHLAAVEGASPPDGTSVWLSVDREDHAPGPVGVHLVAFSQRVKTLVSGRAQVRIYGHILRLHRLVIHVMGSTDGNDPLSVTHELEDDYLVKIWPPKAHLVAWPPPGDLADIGGFDRLAGRPPGQSPSHPGAVQSPPTGTPDP